LRRVIRGCNEAYRGQICEIGTTAEVLEPPYHPYTRMLLDWAADNEPAGGGNPHASGGD
jgi:ABC-type oligopeptide transport system ATPase subunit